MNFYDNKYIIKIKKQSKKQVRKNEYIRTRRKKRCVQ